MSLFQTHRQALDSVQHPPLTSRARGFTTPRRPVSFYCPGDHKRHFLVSRMGETALGDRPVGSLGPGPSDSAMSTRPDFLLYGLLIGNVMCL